jgi:NRPS condensation-like uncharacterized protein
MKKEIDWMGLWYKIIKERGENDEPTFGLINLESKNITWHRFSHMDMDGVGVLNYLYSERGIKIKTPDLKEKKAPNFLELLLVFIKLLFKDKKLKPIWKHTYPTKTPQDVHKISYHIFNPGELKNIFDYCQKLQVTPCAFFMNECSKILLEYFTVNKEGSWTLPVNLRPLVKHQNFNSNHSSGIIVSIKASDPVEKTNDKIKLSLKNKEHWAIWWVHQIGRIIGYQGMKVLSNATAKSNFMLGSFTYLGKWQLPPNELYIGAPPGSKNFPLSIMVMISNDHLSLSLKIHPYILSDESKVDEVLNSITEHILKIVAIG